MDQDLLREVIDLKQKATSQRNRERYDAALATLDEAVRRLREIGPEAAGDDAAQAQLRAELADTLGMQGGVHRRRNDLQAALDAYEAGYQAEGDASASTYNLGNLVLLSILLQPGRIDDGSLDTRITALLQRLRAQTDGPRADEWWAWADLAQFELLSGHADRARQALVRGLATGPGSGEFARPLEVLEEVAAKLEAESHPRAAEIRQFIAYARAAR